MSIVANLNLGLIPTHPIAKRSKTRLSPSKISHVIDCNPVEQKRRCALYDLHRDLIPYDQAWSWQKSIVEEKKALLEQNRDCSDTLIVLQHPQVYTLGTGSSEEFLNFDIKNAPFEIHRAERGGEVTYHGPGQLVMYPILNLRYYKTDLDWYLRALEEVVIRVLFSVFSIKASRVVGLTGVWVGDQKLAAVGIAGSRWIAYHGLALNVTTDLSPFQRIVPCGIRDRGVGSIKGLLNKNISWDNPEILEADDCKLLDITCKSLVDEFCEVFQVELCQQKL